MFSGKRILVTGGTDSFGHFITAKLLIHKHEEVMVFSRDEKKQDDMRQEFSDYENVRFIIGDVRDKNSLRAAVRKVAKVSNPREIEIWNDGEQTWSFLYIDDCIRGTMMFMESDYNKPLNIGSDRLVTTDRLTDIIIKLSGKKIEKRYDLSAPQGVRGRNADLTFAKNILGW